MKRENGPGKLLAQVMVSDQGFGYCDLGQAFERPGMWTSDRM